MKQAPIKQKEKNVESEQYSTQQDALLQARKKNLNNSKESNSFKWLTKHSRDFLAAGYISGNYTAEERIREIADRAESILKINGFSDKFYNYMSEGFYSLASPVWSNCKVPGG
mgnify:FL=1